MMMLLSCPQDEEGGEWLPEDPSKVELNEPGENPTRDTRRSASVLLTEAEAQARVDGHDVVAAIVPAVDATAQTFFEDHGSLVVSGRDEAPQVRLHTSL